MSSTAVDETEMLNINGVQTMHTIIPIVGDGACLFRAIAYLLFGNQYLDQDIREDIVDHVVDNWDEFAIQTHNRYGDNYRNADEYYSEMILNNTYGSACELAAAGQLYPYVFEVYRNGDLYASFGTEGNPILRLRFTDDLSKGHFDAYMPTDWNSETDRTNVTYIA